MKMEGKGKNKPIVHGGRQLIQSRLRGHGRIQDGPIAIERVAAFFAVLAPTNRSSHTRPNHSPKTKIAIKLKGKKALLVLWCGVLPQVSVWRQLDRALQVAVVDGVSS